MRRNRKRRVGKNLFIIAFFITLFLFISILFIGSIIGEKRQEFINTEISKLYVDLNEMQTFILMSETYGRRMACLASKEKLKELDHNIWTLGQKIDEYRIATEEFKEDPYYKQQKKIFNENEVFYLLLLTQLKQQCELDHAIISFFYTNSDDCPDCDAQSFVLADINREINEKLSIFYFDNELNISSIKLLRQYYNITEYPCMTINDEPYCGMHDKKEVMKKICDTGIKIPQCSV